MHEEKKEKRRSRILESAKVFFFKHGHETATMRELAESADMAVGTLYNYFSSKTEILLEIFSSSIRDAVTAAHSNHSILESPFPRSILSYFTLLASVYLEYPKKLWREVLAASYQEPISSGSLLWSLQGAIIQILSEILDREKQKGKIFFTCDSNTLVHHVFGIFFMRFLRYLNTDLEKDAFMEGLDDQLEIIVQGGIRK